jgi:Ankyrin repeats (3 copies)/Lysine methyltransferase
MSTEEITVEVGESSPQVPMTVEECNAESLECARYGEPEDLRALLQSGADANYTDDQGTTALHKAAANGHVDCLVILKEFGALHRPNREGNLPIHWAALNGQVEALQFLFDSYDDIDVLVKNGFGRCTLTEAFQSNKADIISLCLSHQSASEDKLLPAGITARQSADGTTILSTGDMGPSPSVTAGSDGIAGEEAVDERHAVNHDMSFGDDSTAAAVPVLRVRELPISRADNPFGTDVAPEDDTTGLGIWPASLLTARWACANKHLLKGKVVLELGAGCGVPGLAAGDLVSNSTRTVPLDAKIQCYVN